MVYICLAMICCLWELRIQNPVTRKQVFWLIDANKNILSPFHKITFNRIQYWKYQWTKKVQVILECEKEISQKSNSALLHHVLWKPNLNFILKYHKVLCVKYLVLIRADISLYRLYNHICSSLMSTCCHPSFCFR